MNEPVRVRVDFVLKTDRDGGTGLSLEVKLNNNKSAEPRWGVLHR